MADSFSIACPECEKAITVPASMEGKKIRCKSCGEVFPVHAPAARSAGVKTAKPDPAPKPAPKKAPAKKPAAAKAKPGKPAADDDEENSNPYQVTDIKLGARCPNCANDLESEDAVICLHCGYNTRTRMQVKTRKVADITATTVFLWLLPGILCVLGSLSFLGFDIWYLLQCVGADNEIKAKPDAELAWWVHPIVRIWIVLVPSCFTHFFLIFFAVRRLIFKRHPPEVELRLERKK